MLETVLVLSTVALLAQADPVGQADPDARYRACIEQVGTDPEAALRTAQQWSEEGGGALAGHCRGNALMALERPREAASVLGPLSEEMRSEAPAVAARLSMQAAQAWAAAGEPEEALSVLDGAVSLAPDDTAIRTRRGILRARTGDFFAAVDDFNAVLEREPETADVLILRASVYRRLESPELAMDDLARALRIEPDHPDALLERGLLHMIGGDPGAARADWRRVIEVAPQSAAAQLSIENLERLERSDG